MEKKIKLVHLIYGIVVSLLLCLCGALAIHACIEIYRSGPEPFTRASIAHHFGRISWAVYTLIAFILGGAVLNIVLPLEKEKVRGSVNNSLVLARSRRSLKGCSQESYDKMEREQILRFVMLTVSFILILAGSISSLVYAITQLDIYALIDGQENTVDISGEIARASLNILYFYIIPFIYTVVTVYACNASVKRENELVKAEIRNGCATDEEIKPSLVGGAVNGLKAEGDKVKSVASRFGKYPSIALSCILAVVAVVFIVMGIANGGMNDVVAKAIAICRECIGMG
ncbi:MAG: hypothetical protein J6B29_05605 [Clostridia bacterium]|nr:hypothetical protein [Clostridia bacterium]